MTTPVKILAFAGSARRDSFNKKAVHWAAVGATEAGAQVTVVDLRDFPMPLFDQEVEQENPPENAPRLRTIFTEHQGLLISSPEYNSSIAPLLKNTIDWVSRPGPDQPPLVGFTGKVAALMSASPGALGGLRGLVHLRSILGNIGVLLLPDQLAIPKAHEAFHPDGSLKDDKQQAGLRALGKKLAETLRKLSA
ncbi:MAG TPA: NAD(P)H-dependent oxidoreductase [Pirellulales bacterium]|jgi:NAD(P)H-dependent FMN reductase|nr:NAD(P)H-dependent oxidoreductase [Pirellulales bacterium]